MISIIIPGIILIIHKKITKTILSLKYYFIGMLLVLIAYPLQQISINSGSNFILILIIKSLSIALIEELLKIKIGRDHIEETAMGYSTAENLLYLLIGSNSLRIAPILLHFFLAILTRKIILNTKSNYNISVIIFLHFTYNLIILLFAYQ